MKLIFEPSVYLVGKSEVNQSELDRFLADGDIASWSTDTEVGGEKLIEVAGRLCYWSFAKPRPGGNKAYTGHILEVGHGSVLEHAVYNLIFEGVSRSLTHELVRQRAGMGYSQLSQRFVDESDCAFVVPPALRVEVAAAKQFLGMKGLDHPWQGINYITEHLRLFIEESSPTWVGMVWLNTIDGLRQDYARLAEMIEKGMNEEKGSPLNTAQRTARRKAAREAARSVLPNCTETKIFVTGNARALRHFLEMRGDIAADAEIRRLAIATLKVLQVESPNLFGDYVLNHVNGQDCVSTPYTKV